MKTILPISNLYFNRRLSQESYLVLKTFIKRELNILGDFNQLLRDITDFDAIFIKNYGLVVKGMSLIHVFHSLTVRCLIE